MPGVTIRAATAGERDLLEALQRRASLANPGDHATVLANPELIHLPLQQIMEGRVFVAERASQVAGFAVLLPRDDDEFELDGLFVDPPHWRQGIGRQLLDHCMHEARAMGARNLQLVGNTHAEGFYKACGFECAGEIPLQFGSGLLFKLAL